MIDRLNSWLQLTASIGILAGLVLVAVQIQQATDIASAQMQAASFDSTIQANDIIIGEGFAESWARARMNADDLSEADSAASAPDMGRTHWTCVNDPPRGGVGLAHRLRG